MLLASATIQTPSTHDKEVTTQTRKYPRTLVEAFGPYASGPITEDEPMHKHDRIVLVASLLVAVSLFGIVVAGWL